jgi:hypothetical protein
MKSATRRTNRKRATAALGPVSLIISSIPRPYPASAEKLGALVTMRLFDIWEGILSDSELRALRCSQPSTRSEEILDALILKQAETMGWRLGLSVLVHLRFSSHATQRHLER